MALNDLSSSVMTASTGDDNSTKELKGFVIFSMCALKFSLQFLHIIKLISGEKKEIHQEDKTAPFMRESANDTHKRLRNLCFLLFYCAFQ